MRRRIDLPAPRREALLSGNSGANYLSDVEGDVALEQQHVFQVPFIALSP